MVSQETATATGTVWAIDPAHTSVEFAVKHMMVSTVKGRFSDVAGTITGNIDHPAGAQVEVTIAANSIDTRNEQRDAHLRSADFLDAEQYPQITFTSKKIEERNKNSYLVRGDLTIRGTTKEVELEASVNGVGKSPYGTEVVGITASTVLSRQEWGLTWNVALETGGVLVGDALRVNIEVEAVRQ